MPFAYLTPDCGNHEVASIVAVLDEAAQVSRCARREIDLKCLRERCFADCGSWTLQIFLQTNIQFIATAQFQICHRLLLVLARVPSGSELVRTRHLLLL